MAGEGGDLYYTFVRETGVLLNEVRTSNLLKLIFLTKRQSFGSLIVMILLLLLFIYLFLTENGYTS